MHKMRWALSDLAHISAGHPIRDAVRDTPAGTVRVVQIKDIDAATGVDWQTVARTNLTGRREPDWLKPGDILFSARGARNVAVYLHDTPVNAVASPHFFLIRLRDGKNVRPDFIAWQMNQPPAQRYFAQSATGSLVKSIRREVLEKLNVLVPAPDRQQLLVQLAKAALREKQILEQLIDNRQRELDLLAGELLTEQKAV